LILIAGGPVEAAASASLSVARRALGQEQAPGRPALIVGLAAKADQIGRAKPTAKVRVAPAAGALDQLGEQHLGLVRPGRLAIAHGPILLLLAAFGTYRAGTSRKGAGKAFNEAAPATRQPRRT
jgi:hypothetical protein